MLELLYAAEVYNLSVPFTISHIAAVIPLKNKTLSFVAMCIGALIPDAPYILKLTGIHISGHSILGLFVFCFPASLFSCMLYQAYLQPAWKNVFPWLVREQKRSVFVISLSLLIGSSTHLFWDSFTHYTGWIVELVPFFRKNWFTLFGHPVATYRILQHFSSLAGGLMVISCLTRAAKRTPNEKWVVSYRCLFILISVTAVIGILLSLHQVTSLDWYLSNNKLELFVVRLSFRFLAAMGIIILSFPSFMILRNKARTSFS